MHSRNQPQQVGTQKKACAHGAKAQVPHDRHQSQVRQVHDHGWNRLI